MKKLLSVALVSLLGLSSVQAVSENNLPFVGTRVFNFMGGNGTEESITINRNGYTVIKLYGKTSTGILYQGQYQNPLPLEAGWQYMIIGNNAIASIADGKLSYGCKFDSDGRDMPCVEPLYGD